MIAVHVHDPEALFVVPVELCPTSKGDLRLEAPRNNQRRRIRLAADYEFEHWVRSLFDGLD